MIDLGWLTRGLDYAVKQVYTALKGQLTFEDNVRQVTLLVMSGEFDGDSFTVNHNLGRVPQRWLANPTEDCRVWEGDRTLWTDTQLVLRCSRSTTAMTLTVW